MIIAGEASGDLHGGNVLLELIKYRPDLEIFGTGGDLIAKAGARLLYRVEDLAVIGFSEVAKRYSYYKGIFDQMVKALDEERPDVVLLVDYPGFNLKLAAEAKKRGIKVIYYVAPQVWAWKKNRIEAIKQTVDELIVLFPFEVDFFQREGVTAHCFGHPLLDVVKPNLDKTSVINKWSLNPEKKYISMLPGSRRNEISKHLPLLFQTAEILNSYQDNLQFIIPLAPTVGNEPIRPFLNNTKADIKIVEGDTYNVVAHSDFALVASGTATLETAILQTPLIVFYKSSLITYIIGKYFLRIKLIGLPNIIAEEELVPENQRFVSPKKMAEDVRVYLNQDEEYSRIKNNLARIKDDLGHPGAYTKTARFIDSIL